MVSLNTLTVLLGEDLRGELLPAHARIRILDACDTNEAASARKLFVFTPATRLDALAACITEANRHNRLQALLVRSDVEPEWVPYLLKRAGLRTLRNLLVHHDDELPGRVLRAWAMGVQHETIATAGVLGDRLVVVTCAFGEFETGFDAYPALRRIPVAERPRFEVEPDGMFLHWPGGDVHLTLDDVRMAADPRRRARAEAVRRAHDQGFGAAVRALRQSRGINQSGVAGLSARHLRRIENGCVPGDGAIQALAAAHGLSPEGYLDAVSEFDAP